MPPPPCACMAQSITWQAMVGATTLIMAISVRATLLPATSIIQAALSVSRRAMSILQRASAMRSCVTVCWATVLPKATRAMDALAHQFQRALGQADQAHAVVDAAGAEAALGDLEATAFTEQDVADRHAHVLEIHLDMAVRRVVVAQHIQAGARCGSLWCWRAPGPCFAANGGVRRGRSCPW
jgi:hypothetical protein